MSDPQVSVTLIPDDATPSTSRSFNLSRETHTVLIGRASTRGPLPRIPAQGNGWFESRVMSRNHADIIFCHDRNTVYIRDCASTHGTWLNDTILVPGELATLVDGDILRFGIDVERDEEDHAALSALCSIEWINRSKDLREIPRSSVPEMQLNPEPKSSLEHEPTSTNTFSTPGYGSDIIEVEQHSPVTRCQGTTIVIDDDDTPDSNMTAKHLNLVSPILDSAEIPITETLSPNRPLSAVYGGHGPEPLQLYADGVQDFMVREDDEVECGLEYTDDDDSDQSAGEEEGTEDDDEDQSESGASDSSELESSETSSVSYTAGGIQAGFKSDLDAHVSSSDPDYNAHSVSDSNAESANESEGSSDADSDDQNSVSHYDRCIDPTLLADVNEPDIGNNVNAGIDQHVKNEFTDYKTETSVLTDCRAQFPKLETSPGNTSYPVPIASYSSTSSGAYQLTLFREPPHVRYTDGPFACKDDSREETGVDIDAKENKIEGSGSQESVKEEMAPVAEVSLKRKAVEMESRGSHALEPASSSPQQANAEANSKSQSESQSASVTTSIGLETEPPRKRAKSSHSPTSKVASYTATAVLSALLGGLGTIALLASLPPEYFQ